MLTFSQFSSYQHLYPYLTAQKLIPNQLINR